MKKILIYFAALLILTSVGCKNSINQKGNYKDWNKCVHSSNWAGSNAQKRMMNILSPHMNDGTFNDRLNFIKSRGCDTVHVFLTNKADGEKAGYSIYGNKFDWNIDKNYANFMLNRIKKLSKNYYVVMWLAADDSDDWNRTMISNPNKYLQDLNNLGFLKYASIIVTGLEANEYWNANQCLAMYAATKKVYKGKVAIHQTSNNMSLIGACDIFFGQMNPGSSIASIQSYTKKCLSHGKPVCMFELERHEDRTRSQAALSAGAFAIGNW